MKKLALVILDGFGLSKRKKENAIYLAHTPFLDKCLKKSRSVLRTDGEAVGLDKGVFGNSEVGHLNIGCGRVVIQDLTRINQQIKSGDFYKNKALKDAFNTKRVHLIGLVSDGKVHADISHLIELLKMGKQENVKEIFIHIITDGRDTDVHKAQEFIDKIKAENIGKLATISGRFYAMDRDNNLDRTLKYFDALMADKKGEEVESVIKNSYEAGVTDEFIVPTALKDCSPIKEGDSIILYNFRADRMRQLCNMLLEKLQNVKITSFTQYSNKFKKVNVAFEAQPVKMCLGEVLEKYNFKQLRVAETTKFAHVTYFFNGERESAFKNEKRIIVKGDTVNSFVEKPEMKAKEITSEIIKETSKNQYNFVLVNYANCDMVGHTGNMLATIKAVETVNLCLEKLCDHLRKKGYDIIITADHGNADYMLDKNNQPVTTHSTASAPFIFLSDKKAKFKKKGKLSNIAPTILDYYGIKFPKEFTESSLFIK